MDMSTGSDDGDEPPSSDDGDAGVDEVEADLTAQPRGLAAVQALNENGMLRGEVKRLKCKVQTMDREKDQMIDDFRLTTQTLLERIKELEMEVTHASSRPQTAAILERIEGRPAASSTAAPSRPPRLPRAGSGSGGYPTTASHAPEVLRIEEEEPEEQSLLASQPDLAASEGDPCEANGEEPAVCGNCGAVVPEGNLVTHSIHCYRNTYRCTACGEVLSNRDREAHVQHWTDLRRLFDAAQRADIDTLITMERHGVDLAACADPATQDTLVHVAARLGNEELIGFAIGKGGDINPFNAEGASPLHVAIEHAQLPAVKFLVELGADLSAPDRAGETPLIICCRRAGTAPVVSFLMEMRADPQAVTALGDTALQIAQRRGCHETVLAMVSKGAALRPGTPRCGSPLRKQPSGELLPPCAQRRPSPVSASC
jgi:hypothetical protein